MVIASPTGADQSTSLKLPAGPARSSPWCRAGKNLVENPAGDGSNNTSYLFWFSPNLVMAPQPSYDGIMVYRYRPPIDSKIRPELGSGR